VKARPCPVCAAAPYIDGDAHSSPRRWRIFCQTLDHTVVVYAPTKAAAIELWQGCDIDKAAWKPKPKRKR
jgi:hypothetical protein